mmetsp:Transcript_905/g.2635  ORF Transcript_905/g.2635 Transcript_905/m.2635 type:complete len:215 (-) Transcript_905:39-683(-)
MRLVSAGSKSSPDLISTRLRSEEVAFKSVFKSYDVYGPSVNRPGRIIVKSKSSAFSFCNRSKYVSDFLLYFKTPNKFKTTYGILSVLVTPTEDIITNLLFFSPLFFFALRKQIFFAARITFAVAISSVCSGPLFSFHLADGNAVVPKQHTTSTSFSSSSSSFPSAMIVSNAFSTSRSSLTSTSRTRSRFSSSSSSSSRGEEEADPPRAFLKRRT